MFLCFCWDDGVLTMGRKRSFPKLRASQKRVFDLRTQMHTHKLKRIVVVVRRRRSFLLSSQCRSRRESSPSSTRCFLDEQRTQTRNAVGSFRRRRRKKTKTKTKTKTRKKIFLPPPHFHRSSRHRTNSTPRFLFHTTEKKEEI